MDFLYNDLLYSLCAGIIINKIDKNIKLDNEDIKVIKIILKRYCYEHKGLK